MSCKSDDSCSRVKPKGAVTVQCKFTNINYDTISANITCVSNNNIYYVHVIYSNDIFNNYRWQAICQTESPRKSFVHTFTHAQPRTYMDSSKIFAGTNESIQ